MDIYCEAFTCPKSGASPDQNDDAYDYRPGKKTQVSTRLFRCAVADGATESLYAGKWAKCVVKAFTRGSLASKHREKFLKNLRSKWRELLLSYDLPWYAEPKVEQGSFTTLLGLELTAPSESTAERGAWTATAIGDSCLFLIRDDELTMTFPMENPEQFNNHPLLLSSNPRSNKSFSNLASSRHGELFSGDSFYLMTDALALWFLTQVNQGERPWSILRDLGTDAALSFAKWVTSLRNQDDRMNDDMTLLRVEVVSIE